MPTDDASTSYATTRRADLTVHICEVLRVAGYGTWSGPRGGDAELEMRAALAPVCAEAHQQQLRAEQLLIRLKEEWRKRPFALGPTRVDAEVTLANVISLCIDEFYRSTSSRHS